MAMGPLTPIARLPVTMEIEATARNVRGEIKLGNQMRCGPLLPELAARNHPPSLLREPAVPVAPVLPARELEEREM